MKKITLRKIVISFKGAYFSDDVKDGQSAFEYDQLVELLNFLIDNIYINFGDSIFRQTIGIPMGTNSAPLLANLYLFYYEYKFLEKLPKDKKFHGKYFKLTYRFIDDLLSINNKYFREYISQIYPDDLELKETTENDKECLFLDIMMYNNDGGIKFKLYDKREDFEFNIANYPHLDSNIPLRPAYGVSVSRLTAFARVCTDFEHFDSRHSALFDTLVKQGYSKIKLKCTFLKFLE